MPKSARYLDLPFDEAIAFFRAKLNMPTATWKDLWKEMHARAFSVAGAMKEDLLKDLREAIDRGISEGTTLTEFRESFDTIIQKYGWKYKGAKGWRTAVMFNTNVSVAYTVGHYTQMMDPAVLKIRPYLRYVRSYSAHPRPEHLKWVNTVLPADDPWWNTHYPPNGWGCKCTVVSMSGRELERLRKTEANGLYPVKTKAPRIHYYDWLDKDSGVIHKIPEGIDPGWDYNVGAAGFRDQP